MSDAAQPAPKLSDAEHLKANSRYLRGTIRDSLAEPLTGAVSEGDGQLLKFHGTYQQDDRDLRNERAVQKLEPAFEFMVRVRAAGGVVTPAQWLALDGLSQKYGMGGLRLTTRQSFEIHGVLKWKLRDTIHDINQLLLTTLATCGDVNRNVMCSPNPPQSEVHQEVFDWSVKMTEHLLPKTTAYHELWIGDEKIFDTRADHEPVYGPTYLPRKFKIGVAVPPQNDIDVFTQDLGFIAIVERGRLAGFNVVVGGGMGMTHGETATFPNVGWVIGYTPASRVVDVAEKVVLVQRDFGDRTNRKHARLKYTITDRGVDWFKAELNRYLGWSLEPERPYEFQHRGDRYGWTKGINGKWNLTLYIENGRVLDWEGYPLLSGLRAIAAEHQGDFRLTANQNVILGNVPEGQRKRIDELVAHYRLRDGRRDSALRRNAMACVSLPKCSLAMAEAERYMPAFLDKLESLLAELGLSDDEIVVRMTGCPNGCARPFVAEIALVGKALGKYNVYLGADFVGRRLNKLYRENIGEEEILDALRPVLQQYARERTAGERFGDFCIRSGIVRQVSNGPDFHAP